MISDVVGKATHKIPRKNLMPYIEDLDGGGATVSDSAEVVLGSPGQLIMGQDTFPLGLGALLPNPKPSQNIPRPRVLLKPDLFLEQLGPL